MVTTRKRVVAGIAAGALALGLAACGDGGGEGDGGDEGGVDEADLEGNRVGAMEDYGVGDTFVATEPVEFSLLYRDHPNYPLDEDWLFFEQLASEHNVTFDITTAPLSDWEQRRSLLIGAGDAPHMIPVTYPGQEAAFVASGVLLPVSDYLDLLPNFQAKVEEWDLGPELDTLRQEDGKFYLLPGIYENLRSDYTLGMRIDVLEEAGATEPETWEDVRTALAQIKEHTGTQYAFSDRWQANSLLNYAAPSFGTSAGWGYGEGLTWDPDEEQFVYTGATDEYRALVEYFHSLVADGLMDPESFTQDDELAIQKLSNEQSFGISVNAQELTRHVETLEAQLGTDDFELRKIVVPAGPEGDIIGGSRLESGIMISSDAAQDENFVAMMQFIDWLYYSDEGLEFARWGVEGETFNVVDGERVLAEDVDFLGQNPDGSLNLQVDFGFFNGVFSLAHGSTQDLVLTHISEEEIAWAEQMAEKEQAPLPPPYPLNEMEREQVSLYATSLADYTNNATLQFILGQRPMSEWDAYVAELEGMNMQAYLDVANTAQERYAESNA